MQLPEQQIPQTTDEVKPVSVAEAIANEENRPPEVEAAMFLQGALPAFRQKLEKVTGTQAKRVLAALTEAPLEKETPGFTTREAEDLFMLGLMISNAKFILFTTALRDKEMAASVEEAAKEAGAEVAKTETQGETNGN